MGLRFSTLVLWYWSGIKQIKMDSVKRSGIILLFFSLMLALPLHAEFSSTELQFKEEVYEGKSHYVIATPNITYYYDMEGGGFSRMIDRSGRDWISFKREPWGEYPASAASAFRGIPNLVFNGDDGGAGHPGHEKCTSYLEGNKIVSESLSGIWKWTWEFFDSYAVLEVLKVDPDLAYWFLYEGTPGGAYTPDDYFFGTSNMPPAAGLPDFYKGENIFGHFQWIYCGAKEKRRSFFMIQLTPDEQVDLVGYLGNTKEGVNSPDGMTVFGFGRDENTTPLLSGKQKFVIGLYPKNLDDKKQVKKFETFLKSKFEIQSY